MYPQQFFADHKLQVKNGQCFAVMPFAKEFDEVFASIKAALESPDVGFTCVRADELFGGGHIMEDVLRCIAESEIIIADLTGRNPNVFYELGVVHMVKDVSKVLMIAQNMDDVPFDLRPFRCIDYTPSAEGLSRLRDKLAKSINVVSKTAYRFAVADNGNYVFEKRLAGPDRCFYTFEIPELWTARTEVKFRLRVSRHAIGQPSTVSHDDGHFLPCGKEMTIPGTSWQLVLDAIDAQRVANFRVIAV